MSRKRLFGLLLSAALVGLLAVPRTASAQTLLSQGKTAVSSSVEGTLVAANAVDGNTGTRWGSAFSDPQWIYVDLGASANITRVVLSWEAAYGKAYQIQVADDPSGTWTTLFSTTTGDGGTDDLTVSGTGRYVRVYGTARGLTAYGYSLWEFQVYGTPVGAATLLSQGKPATASSAEGDLVAANAVDGNAGTRWGSAFTGSEWIQVDLGGTATLSRVVLSWEAAYGAGYQLQVAASAAGPWTNVYTTTTGDGGTDDLTVSGTGRYVRMNGTARGLPAYGYSLWEFQVYGTMGAPTCATLPGAPTGLTASSVASTSLTLSWTAPSAGAGCTLSGYNVYRGGTLVGTFSGTSAAITGLTASTAYSFTVAAVNGFGTGPQSAALPVTTPGGTTCSTVPGAPTGLASSAVTSSSVTLSWTAPSAGANCTISGYRVYQNGAQAATPAGTTVAIGGLAASTSYAYTVAAVNQAGVGPQSAPALTVVTGGSATNPDFGPNVTLFDPSMSAATVQAQINAIYAVQQNNQFGTARNAILFKPGSYAVDLPVGFYTQVAGLGALPTQVSVSNVHSDAYMANGNATQNFWRGLENFSVTAPPGAGMQWAVSQACPFRRMSLPNNNIILFQASGSQNWSSGGWMSDSSIRYDVTSGSQQQWISRNSQWGSWTGAVWNMVFVGIPTGILPGGTWPTVPNTFVNPTPVVAEKPFLWLNGASYEVYVPALRTNLDGITWGAGQTPGTSIALDQFYVAHAGDSAATINAALSQGKHLLLTPGIYDLTAPIQVTRANTVVMGMGFATLHPTAGTAALTVADVDGVRISHLLVDAGATSSPVLVQVGPTGSGASHAASPTILADVFVRVGGAGNGAAGVAMQVNSNNVIIDHTWLWRADHGAGAGWTTNPSANGLVVNGQNVTAYGLFVEHFQQYQVIWNGNGGRTYFYQSEIPYDPPNQASWTSGAGVNGWASYKVADSVTSHEAWGMGIYAVFTNANVYLSRAIETPNNAGVRFHHLITVNLTANGGIQNVINGVGGPTPPGIAVGTPKVDSYP